MPAKPLCHWHGLNPISTSSIFFLHFQPILNILIIPTIGQEFPDVNGEFRVYIPFVYTPYRLINLSHPL